MKAKSWLFSLALLALGGVACAADSESLPALISFSTSGPDVYADGSPVLDGEWYALVWSPDGAFGGITTTCTPARSGDAVVLTAPLAKDGKCPFTVFNVPTAQAKSGGTYAVYMLDTRNAAKTAPAARGADGKPVLLNGVVASKTYTAASVEAQGTAASGTWAESAVDTSDASFAQAKITAFRVVGANVEIEVSGMMGGVKYNVLMGGSPDALDAYALDVPQTAEKSTFVISKDRAQFFRVVREPLVK